MTNFFLSSLATGLVQAVGSLSTGRLTQVRAVLPQFCGVALTLGFVLSAYLYHLFRRHEVPMYQNHGLSFRSCLAGAYVLHILVLALLSLLIHAAGVGRPG